MSTPRFPRTRIYRDLARLEAEVNGWSIEYSRQAHSVLNPHDESKLFLQSYELEQVAELIHEAADAMGRIFRLRLSKDGVGRGRDILDRVVR